MKIVLVEPFFSGSHQTWAEAFQQFSKHDVHILSLKGRHWKWRMIGGAVSLAKKFMDLAFKADLLLVTDMLDLNSFLGLTRKKTAGIPVAIYFHENQITYPWSPEDQDIPLKRNHQYGFINYTSALAADVVLFNSEFHKTSFLNGLNNFLRQFPDEKNLENIDIIKNKTRVLPLGLSLKRFLKFKNKIKKQDVPILLWNHRWEYDKNPVLFFETLFRLKEEGIDFKLVVLGDAYQKQPKIFSMAKEKLKAQTLHFGFVNNFETYAQWLWQADILPVTSHQDFFGGSVVEAIYCQCFPILPQRLAYPEHIPEVCKSDVFYETDAVFYQKLKSALVHPKGNSYNASLQNFVAQYDWSTLASYYDLVFENIATT
ncbi:MAG TPA: DUF3524 domain-containing protein [Saprospiraceae bacterium]|nr:DUF3524 domain-containing protein [Saprospiraceae bacterium]